MGANSKGASDTLLKVLYSIVSGSVRVNEFFASLVGHSFSYAHVLYDTNSDMIYGVSTRL